MNLFEMTDFELSDAHSATLAKAKAARAAGDLDGAHAYVEALRPMNVEIFNRMKARREATIPFQTRRIA